MIDSPSRRRVRLRWRIPFVVLAVGLALAALALIGLAERTCAEPLDVSGTLKPGGLVAELKGRDEIVYPAHALLGAGLDLFGCAPAAAGLQWLKAAAHARSDSDVQRAAGGLVAAREREAAESSFERTLCAYVADGYARPAQAAALAAAGLHCPAPPAPSP